MWYILYFYGTILPICAESAAVKHQLTNMIVTGFKAAGWKIILVASKTRVALNRAHKAFTEAADPDKLL